MAKKKPGLEDLGGLVFSTNNDFDEDQHSSEDQQEFPEPEEQELEAHFSSKGRGGKTVTIIKGFVGPEEDLIALGKKLKKKCGVGGSAKDGEIIIQGDDRDKIMQLLEKDGYNVKRVGG
ncbi:translation initiation factor [Autumnicola musiva]|uniref:Translation initiation factor n=1 Tax=Autumnicola musiva TaxID=3075589 RepID=A0ABU3D785_9FLAO|nr:translation initiation factor [Zunongwangia sp. F117]MDT0677378.1 translation initiation factor [Zunongwangia sp. F117]